MSRTARDLRIGILAMAATAFLWSSSGLFIKIIDWNPFAIAGTRSLIASGVIWVFVRNAKFHFSRTQVLAACANVATMLLFVAANKTTTAANAIVLQYFSPGLTAVLAAMILHEKAHVEQWVAFAVSLLGMIALFHDRLSGGTLLGDAMALLSGVSCSFFYVLMRMQKQGNPLESLLLSHWLTATICAGVSLFMPVPRLTLASAGAVAFLGVMQIGVPALLFSLAIRRVSALSANLIALIEPIFNPLWVFLAVGEAPGPGAIIGGLATVSAVAGASMITAKRTVALPAAVDS